MSDSSQGEGWWLASDGKWYPPTAVSASAPPPPTPPVAPPAAAPPGPPPAPAPSAPGAPVAPPPASTGMSGCLKAFLIVFAICVVGGILLVVLSVVTIGTAAKKASDRINSNTASAAKSCEGWTYADHQDFDHCADGNGEVRDLGLTLKVSNLRVQSPGTSTGSASSDTSGTSDTGSSDTGSSTTNATVCADVTLTDRNINQDRYRNYAPGDFNLRTPSGQTAYAISSGGTTLGSGVLSHRGSAKGKVCWYADASQGDFMVLWNPGVSLDRGVWKFTLR